MIPIELFKQRAMEYAVEKIVPSLGATGNAKFLVGMGLGVKLRSLEPALDSLGVLTKDGVDLAALDTAMTDGFKAADDGKFRFSHKFLPDVLVFTKDDWDTFKSTLR